MGGERRAGSGLDAGRDLATAGGSGRLGAARRGRRVPLPPVGSVLAVAVGGALGVGLRYAVVVRYPVDPGGFPWPTLVVNLSGAFVLGLVLTLFVERLPSSRHRRALLCTGLLGAYTTFSTVAVELATLLVDGYVATAAGYATVTLAAGLGAALLGSALARGRPTGSRP